jgi:hypothetical protein
VECRPFIAIDAEEAKAIISSYEQNIEDSGNSKGAEL